MIRVENCLDICFPVVNVFTFSLTMYGTAHSQVYNHTRVLARDPNKTHDFCSGTQAIHMW